LTQSVFPPRHRVRFSLQYDNGGRYEPLLKRQKQAATGVGMPEQGRVEELQRAFCRVQIMEFPQQITHALKSIDRDAVAGWCSMVITRLGTMDQIFMIMAGKEKTAGFLVFKLVQKNVG